MDVADEPDYAEPQRRVQRWLGRCMLMLQQYEKLLKAFLHDMQIEAWWVTEADGQSRMEHRRAFSPEALRTMTLGTLVKHFTWQFVALEEQRTQEQELADDGVMRMRFRRSLPLQTADYDRLVADLRQLVDLRNLLVHHWIDQFDLQTVDGCESAQQALEKHYERALAHWEELRNMARHVNEASEHFVRWVQSPEHLQMLTTGIVPLTHSSILQALRETLTRLSPTNEFVSLAEVVAEISARSPGEHPKHYGYSTWQQLIHESGLFDLRRAGTASSRSARRLRLRQALAAPLPAGDATVSALPSPAAPPALRTPAPPPG